MKCLYQKIARRLSSLGIPRPEELPKEGRYAIGKFLQGKATLIVTDIPGNQIKVEFFVSKK